MRDSRSIAASAVQHCRRYASTAEARAEQVSEDYQDLESQSSFLSNTPFEEEKIKSWNPIKRAQGRRRQLPPSRYVDIAHF